MSPEREHEEIESLLGAFVLGATDAEEEEMVRAHLPGCASCTATVRRLERAVGAIPFAVEAVTPPTRLREQILAAAAAARPPARAMPQRTRVLRLPAPRLARIWTSAGVRSAVAAAAIIAFALGLGLGAGIGRSVSPPPPSSTGVAEYALHGSGAMAVAQGHAFELKQQGLTLVEFSGMPALEAGKVYELWLIPEQGDPVPAAVFKPDAEGSHVVVLARNLLGVKALAVTAEAGPNGTTAPTQQPQLIGTVG